MTKINLLALVLLCLSIFGCVVTSAPNNRAKLEAVEVQAYYREGQAHFKKKAFKKALPLLEKFVEKSLTHKMAGVNYFEVLDQIGTVYLWQQKEPDKALDFFRKMSRQSDFSEAASDTVSEWIWAVTDWTRSKKAPGSITEPDRLFRLGEDTYKRGIRQIRSHHNKSAQAQFDIAANYLVYFIKNNAHHEQIGRALLMMADARNRVWSGQQHWAGTFYLKEVIRRFPHSAISRKAASLLSKRIKSVYQSIPGYHTPPSVVKMLEHFTKLAEQTRTEGRKK